MSKHITQSNIVIERVVLDILRTADCELTSTQRLVLLALSRFCNKETLVSWPGQSTLAKMCRLGRPTVNKAIAVLAEQNYISITRRGGETNVYDMSPVFLRHTPKFRESTHPVSEADTNGAVNGAVRTRFTPTGFKKPTAGQVQAYLDEIGDTSFTGGEFTDANEQKGWTVGKFQTPMKNWKAAVRTWIRNRKTWGESDANYREKELEEIRKEEGDG